MKAPLRNARRALTMGRESGRVTRAPTRAESTMQTAPAIATSSAPSGALRTVASQGWLAGLCAAFLAGCAVGPDYERPSIETPGAYRRAASDSTILADAESFANLGWWEVFNDPQLSAYLAEALTNNWDVQIAAARVMQAEAVLGIARADFFPTVAAGGDLQTARASERGPTPIPPGISPQAEYGDLFASMAAYEVDLWGRIRRANEAARAELLASEASQRTVRQTLVANVASTYLDLLRLDYEREIARRTLAARTNSLALTQAREEGGVASMQDVAQARILVASAEASIVDITRRQEQQENALCVLLGRNPGPIARGSSLPEQSVRVDVPAGLPSDLLERRPDVRLVEEQLVAANADIGQAKAAFFPQLTLTGLYGFQTVALSDLFTGPAQTWQFGPAVTVPLFTGGRLRGNLQLAQARFQEAVARYRQTVQNAFREVSDSLIAYQRSREYRERLTERTAAHRQAVELATIRYEGGVTSYLEVLYNDQELFAAELELARARLNEHLSVVQLYRALGGGWQRRPNEEGEPPQP